MARNIHGTLLITTRKYNFKSRVGNAMDNLIADSDICQETFGWTKKKNLEKINLNKTLIY